MKQLMPTSTPLCRVKIKLFGHSGSGKSTLADSLKCGYFGSFFRKARLSSSTSVATDGGVTKNNGKALGSVHTALLAIASEKWVKYPFLAKSANVNTIAKGNL